MYRQPIRRGLLVVAVVLLVAVAGCSGLSGDTEGTPTASPSENTTATPESATGTPEPDAEIVDQQTPTDSSETDPAGSLEANGTGADLDGDALNNATSAAIVDAGSYTSQSEFLTVSQSRRGRSARRSTAVTQVDMDADRGLRVTNQSVSSGQFSQNSSRTVYTDGNTSYRQTVTSEGTNYSTQEGAPTSLGGIRPVNTSSFSQNVSFVSDGLVWETNGTTTVDGDTVTEYTLAGVDDTDTLTEGSDATLTDIGGTLSVDGDDVVRQVSLVYSVQTASSTSSVRLRLSLTDIGSTTVAEPDWTSEARNSSS